VFLIGLTGGIASGKSTVAKLLASYGAETIDADQVARDVVLPRSVGLQAVVKEFGAEVLSDSGELDRDLLGQIVFKEPEKRKALEQILHPLIKKRTTELLAASKSSVVVYAVPLLVEANVDYPFDMILTVEAGVENQVERIVRSRGLSEADALRRIDAQASTAERSQRADFVIDSSGTHAQLEQQIATLWEKIEQAAENKIS
jgi:dephospho-CoA kinase